MACWQSFKDHFTKRNIIYMIVFVCLLGGSVAACFVVEAPWDGSDEATIVINPDNTTTVTLGTDAIVPGDMAWMLISTALVLLMTPGLAFFYGGMVGSRNVISTMLQNVIAMGIISFLWVIIGFSFAFGADAGHFYGVPWSYWMFRNVGGSVNAAFAPTISFALFAIFQMMFAVITPALITGSFAERVRFPGYLAFIVLWHIVVYCPVAHWTWHPQGFLRMWGVLDFAGGTVVHMTAGWAALAGALVLGRRKIHVDKEKHVPANIPYVILGTGLLWFGWFGFNAGSALAANNQSVSAFLNTNTAAAMAMLTWMFFDGAQGRKLSATGACVGAVVGLVAITPACGYVTVQDSIFIGFIAAVISNVACTLKAMSPLDDTLDVFPCHGVGGMTGLICTGFFARNVGIVAGQTQLFAYSWLALIIVAGYAFVVSLILYYLVDFVLPMRVDPWKEERGLDVSQHGETLYTFDDLDTTVASLRSGSLLHPRKASVVEPLLGQREAPSAFPSYPPPAHSRISSDEPPVEPVDAQALSASGDLETPVLPTPQTYATSTPLGMVSV